MKTKNLLLGFCFVFILGNTKSSNGRLPITGSLVVYQGENGLEYRNMNSSDHHTEHKQECKNRYGEIHLCDRRLSFCDGGVGTCIYCETECSELKTDDHVDHTAYCQDIDICGIRPDASDKAVQQALIDVMNSFNLIQVQRDPTREVYLLYRSEIIDNEYDEFLTRTTTNSDVQPQVVVSSEVTSYPSTRPQSFYITDSPDLVYIGIGFVLGFLAGLLACAMGKLTKCYTMGSELLETQRDIKTPLLNPDENTSSTASVDSSTSNGSSKNPNDFSTDMNDAGMRAGKDELPTSPAGSAKLPGQKLNEAGIYTDATSGSLSNESRLVTNTSIWRNSTIIEEANEQLHEVIFQNN